MTERRLRIAIAALAVVGLGISLYLTIERIRGRDPACVVGGGCGTVQKSEYADLAGIPIPVLGLLAYAALLVTAVLTGPWARLAGLLAGLVGVGFSAWLTWVELGIIDAICAWCVASAVVMTAAAALTIWRVLLPDPG